MSVGIGIPDTIDNQTGLVNKANIYIFSNQLIALRFPGKIGQPVAISNDANSFTLSEAIDGRGKGMR